MGDRLVLQRRHRIVFGIVVGIALALVFALSHPLPSRAAEEGSDGSLLASADGTATEEIHWDTNAGGTNGMHYVYSVPGDSSSTPIYLYCMNGTLHWPHVSSPTIPTIPNYVQGYLTPEMFESPAQYQECMDKLLAIMYAGFPYNGMNYYTLVDSNSITEEEFNALLQVPDYLRSDFSDALGDATFTWDDYTNTEKMAVIDNFIKEVGTYYPYGDGVDKVTPSGLTYRQLTQLPFYRAALAMQYASWQPSETTPMKQYDLMNRGATTLTEQQAYDQTQDAVWVLLTEYNIPHNALTRDDIANEELALKLLTDASAENVLDSEPSSDALSLSGVAVFSYDPSTGTWRTGTLTLQEGQNYNGLYTISLPDGVYANTDSQADIDQIGAGQSFYLVTKTEPTQNISLTLSESVPWLKEVRQYSPTPENFTASVDGKAFQHMIGALIYQKALTLTAAVAPSNEGGLTVSKTVVGESEQDGSGSKAAPTSFDFTVTLDNTAINGTYGDLTFTDGVATFSLGNDESKTATDLPAGTRYTVTEAASNTYTTTSENANGEIVAGQTSLAAFTNTLVAQTPVTSAGSDDVDSEEGAQSGAAAFVSRMPNTGDAAAGLLVPLAVCSLAAAGLILVALKLRRRA